MARNNYDDSNYLAYGVNFGLLGGVCSLLFDSLLIFGVTIGIGMLIGIAIAAVLEDKKIIVGIQNNSNRI